MLTQRVCRAAMSKIVSGTLGDTVNVGVSRLVVAQNL
jgi:hypothetical protein